MVPFLIAGHIYDTQYYIVVIGYSVIQKSWLLWAPAWPSGQHTCSAITTVWIPAS